MELGIQIKEVRKLKQLTQKQLAKKTGLSEDTISAIESGRNPNPTIYVVKKISESLDNIEFDIYNRKQNLKT